MFSHALGIASSTQSLHNMFSKFNRWKQGEYQFSFLSKFFARTKANRKILLLMNWAGKIDECLHANCVCVLCLNTSRFRITDVIDCRQTFASFDFVHFKTNLILRWKKAHKKEKLLWSLQSKQKSGKLRGNIEKLELIRKKVFHLIASTQRTTQTARAKKNRWAAKFISGSFFALFRSGGKIKMSPSWLRPTPHNE